MYSNEAERANKTLMIILSWKNPSVSVVSICIFIAVRVDVNDALDIICVTWSIKNIIEGVRTKPRLSQFFSYLSLGNHSTKKQCAMCLTHRIMKITNLEDISGHFVQYKIKANHFCPRVPQTKIAQFVFKWLSLGFVLTPSIQLKVYIFFINIFRRLQLEIALAIPASND